MNSKLRAVSLSLVLCSFLGCGTMTPARLQAGSNDLSKEAGARLAEQLYSISAMLEDCENCLNSTKEKRLELLVEFRLAYPQCAETSEVFARIDRRHLETTMQIFRSIREIIAASFEEALVLERESNGKVQELAEKAKTSELEKRR